MIAGNQQVFQQGANNNLCQAASALFKLYRISRQPSSKAPVVSKNNLLTTLEQVLFEVLQEVDDEEECSIEPSQLAELYRESFFVRFEVGGNKKWMGIPMKELEILNTLDFEKLNEQVVKSMHELKAKDIFKLVELHELAMKFMHDSAESQFLPRDVQSVHKAILGWLHREYSKLMP